jgi:hypothetical protein
LADVIVSGCRYLHTFEYLCVCLYLCSETAVTKPLQKQNGYKFISVICNGHSPTDKSVRSGVAVTVRNSRGR